MLHVKYFVNINNGRYEGTSLLYFIYMCIVPASSVSTTTCIDHHFFIVSFLSEMNYFFDGKNKLIKHTKQFISPIKNLRANVLFNKLSVFQINESFFYDSFVKRATQKKYIALANTCVNKDDFICVNKLLNASV